MSKIKLQPHEFCIAVKCPCYEPTDRQCLVVKELCMQTAWDLFDWLKTEDFEIVRRVKNES